MDHHKTYILRDCLVCIDFSEESNCELFTNEAGKDRQIKGLRLNWTALSRYARSEKISTVAELYCILLAMDSQISTVLSLKAYS